MAWPITYNGYNDGSLKITMHALHTVHRHHTKEWMLLCSVHAKRSDDERLIITVKHPARNATIL
jgi:hypothetical protein